MHKTKVAFLYPSHYPITGGSSLHGYFLAKELSALGYDLLAFPQQEDGFTRKLRYNMWSVFWAMMRCDIAYIRISPEGRSLRLLRWVRFLGKKHIVELNGPTDELKVTKKYTQDKVDEIDSMLRFELKQADAVVTVSAVMLEWCREVLGLEHVYVIENGGANYSQEELEPSVDMVSLVGDMQSNHNQLVIWSGNAYPWQGIDTIMAIIELAPDDTGFVLVSDDIHVFEKISNKRNVRILPPQSHEDMRYLITRADVGLALYGDFSWFRLKRMYNSSLKLYEYLANGLWVVTNHQLFGSQQLYVGKTATDMAQWLKKKQREGVSPGQPYRSWKQVAAETAILLQKYV